MENLKAILVLVKENKYSNELVGIYIKDLLINT